MDWRKRYRTPSRSGQNYWMKFYRPTERLKNIHWWNTISPCRTRHRGGLKIVHGKEQISGILFFNGEWSLFKESPPSIMVTRNPNWSTEILWFGTGYVKGKILSPLKRSAWGRLHCWFCLKLLNIYWFMLWWFPCNIPDSGASEYSTTNNSNSGVGKYYVAIK